MLPSPKHPRRTCYVNFAEHLLNSYNPNVLYPGLPHRWDDAQWASFLDQLAAFGYTCFEFWLVPRLFCPAALSNGLADDFTRQMTTVTTLAHARGLQVEWIAALSTVGDDWHTHCPHDPAEWAAVRALWTAWLQRLPHTDIVGLFPGDPGGCSRNGCTATTYIDAALEIAGLVQQHLPHAEVELHTWGPPFFGWGNLAAGPDWRGEFIQSAQSSGWHGDPARTAAAMQHLLRRLPEFPENTSVAINLGFNPDGNPGGADDATAWARAIAQQRPILTWDFSLTEGENAIYPHYRLDRLFKRRQEERAAAPYSGGICFTMSPLLNQLSLFAAAQSFLDPGADPKQLAATFFGRLFGPPGRQLMLFFPNFEIVPDWGNPSPPPADAVYSFICFSRLAELLETLDATKGDGTLMSPAAADSYRRELLFHAQLFADFTGPAPDYDDARARYWQHVYAIWDQLPVHVDPRPKAATDRLVWFFKELSPRE